MKNQGFTLIELSIVIVIIGLIVAGVTGGQVLVEQAKNRQVINDISKFDVAFNSFILQYGARPGDLATAHDYWGSTCHSSESTCNGDGDGEIWSNNTESYMVWRHLQLADMLDGEYTGVTTGSNPVRTAVNSPMVNGFAVYMPTYNNTYKRNHLNVRVMTASSSWDPAFSGATLRSIDTKMDDGSRVTGNVRGENANGTTCSSGNVDAGYYALNDTKTCMGAFFFSSY